MNEQREAIAKVLSAEKCKPHKRQMIDGITAATWDESNAVIAHLWREAMQPEVVDDVAASIPFAFLSSHSIETVRTNWETREEIMGDRSKLVLRREALNAITALLTALLGPNPNEQEAEHG